MSVSEDGFWKRSFSRSTVSLRMGMEGTTRPYEKSGVGSDACQPQPAWGNERSIKMMLAHHFSLAFRK
jgi:hypothetical protein